MFSPRQLCALALRLSPAGRSVARRLPRVFAASALLAAAVGVAHAQYVKPASYVATPGQVGQYTYFDDTGSQLTDGTLGVNNWAADLGNGPAYEGVGWRTVDPTVTFTFASPVTVSKVEIDFNRAAWAAIYLPSAVTVNGENFTLSENEIPDQTRGWLPFTLTTPFTGTNLTLNLSDNDSYRWIFVDEVRFVSSDITSVPEPGVIAFATVAGLAMGGLVLRRRAR